MKRPFLAALALALALVAVPGASGKWDLKVIRVCGPDACAETRDDAVREALSRLFAEPYQFASAPAVGPYYLLRGVESSDAFGAFVPGVARPLRWSFGVTPAWYDVGTGVRAELDKLASAIRPYTQPRPARVVINGRLARRPARFIGLFGDLTPRARPRATGPTWIPITIVWTRPNPWTDASSMFYDPDDRALFRGGRWFVVPQPLVRAITRR
jgi:hypothetical protein